MKGTFFPRLGALPRVPLAHLPTPLEELSKLRAVLGGPTILIKRDDQTGLAFGGNKTRKLEFLLADALQKTATTIVTAGSGQSNHCRQTAAAAAKAGLECDLVLGGQEAVGDMQGNLLLDYLFGARVHWTGRERRGERMLEIAEGLRQQGKRPYVITYGGSDHVGAVGYALAMVELMDQLASAGASVDCIVVASSSGGTQAGLLVGARAAGFPGRILGISIDKGDRQTLPYEEEIAALSRDTALRLGRQETFSPSDVEVDYGYLGKGYGVMGEMEREAIFLLARTEGILLDPVYTGRAMGALIDMIRRDLFTSHNVVLFWHTGGAPALFAYTRELGLTGAAVR